MLRLLTRDDAADLLALSTAAGWNQTVDDWRTLLDLAPQSCWGIQADGRIVSSATLVCYGTRLAWVGMVLTLPGYRRRGFARCLLDKTLDRARELGIETVKLDATDAGRPLYESLGFRVEQPVERWARPGDVAAIAPNPCAVPETVDRRACGCARTALLHLLADRSRVTATPSAYAMLRPGRVSAYLGPCVAPSPAEASALIESLLAPYPAAACYWDLFSHHTNAAALAASLGFQPVRKLLRMSLGKELRGDDKTTYAIAGFEFG